MEKLNYLYLCLNENRKLNSNNIFDKKNDSSFLIKLIKGSSNLKINAKYIYLQFYFKDFEKLENKLF